MSLNFRILLIIISILTAFWILSKIRKVQLKIEDSLFWLLLSMIIIVISLFPFLVEYAAVIFGVASPVNFVFLAIIFVLIIKLFLLSMKLSRLEQKFQQLTQTYSINEYLHDNTKTNKPNNKAV